VQDAVSNRFSASVLRSMGVQGEPTIGNYTLAFTMTAQDVAAA
jgi:hypothetical protein